MADFTKRARIVKKAIGGMMIRLGKGRYVDLPEPGQVFGGGAGGWRVLDNGAEYDISGFERTLEIVGFSGSSSVRQDGYLQEAIARHEYNGGGRLVLPPYLAGKTVRMDSELVVDVSKTTLIGAGHVFDHSNQSSGNTLSVKGYIGEQNAGITRHATQKISGIRWLTNDQPALVGVGAAAGGSAGSGWKFGYLLENCAWVGFHTSYLHDATMWANTFRHCGWWPALSSGGDISKVLSFPLSSSVGERVQLHDCTATNGGIFIDLNAPNVDVHLNGVSIDDFDSHINASTGRIFGSGLHIENGKSTDHWIKLTGTNTAVHLDVLEFIIRAGLTMNYELASVADTLVHGGLIVGQTHVSIGGTYNFGSYVAGGGRAKLGELTELDSQTRVPWSRSMNVSRPFEDANSADEWLRCSLATITTNSLTLSQSAVGRGVKISSASSYFTATDTGTRIQDAGSGAAIIVSVLDGQNVLADIVSSFSSTMVESWRHFAPKNTGAPVRDTVTTYGGSAGAMKFVADTSEAFVEAYFDVSGGKTLRGSYKYKRLNCAGVGRNLSVLLSWCDKNKRAIGSGQTLATHTGADSDWTQARFSLTAAQVAPEGAACARIRFYANAVASATGEMWVDDLIVNTI